MNLSPISKPCNVAPPQVDFILNRHEGHKLHNASGPESRMPLPGYVCPSEHSLAAETNPLIGRRRNTDLDVRICLQLLVNVLEIAGAEPQLAALLKAEYEGAALGPAIQ